MTAEYVIHAKVKNNLLLSRILETHPNVRQFCEANGLSQSVVGDLINMKTPAILRDGSWSKAAIDLADVFMEHPGELFTEEQRVAELKTNELFVEIRGETALRIVNDGIHSTEARLIVNKLLSSNCLNKQDRLVLRMRGIDELTLTESAKVLGVTQERVRQIEARAMRKAKNFLRPKDAPKAKLQTEAQARVRTRRWRHEGGAIMVFSTCRRAYGTCGCAPGADRNTIAEAIMQCRSAYRLLMASKQL